jgi:hypothetical protein
MRDLGKRAGSGSPPIRMIGRRFTMSAPDYVYLLSTVSAYLELPASEQAQVYSEIMQVLPEAVEIAADITVHLARSRRAP